MSRANFLGGQRYAATWTGDNKSSWDHLKLSIPMSLSLSLSGQPFNGPDIGGFEGNCNPELLAHWMALGTYYPFSRNHASKNSINQEPWVFGKKLKIFQEQPLIVDISYCPIYIPYSETQQKLGCQLCNQYFC